MLANVDSFDGVVAVKAAERIVLVVGMHCQSARASLNPIGLNRVFVCGCAGRLNVYAGELVLVGVDVQ
jgi:hypothetical protein